MKFSLPSSPNFIEKTIAIIDSWILPVLLFSAAFLCTTYAIGQIYDGLHEDAVGRMDIAADDHLATKANVKMAGEELDAMPQEELYADINDDMDAANERHFNTMTDNQGVRDIPSIE